MRAAVDAISVVGGQTIRAIEAVGDGVLLWLRALGLLAGSALRGRFRYREFMEQAYGALAESLPIIAFSLTFISLMQVIEFSFHMKLVLRQDSLVPSFSTVLLVRELGPVVTSLLLTSRVGAGIAAELGIMKVTDQIEALRLLRIDPIEYLVVPRLLACVLASVALNVIALAVALAGSTWLAAGQMGMGPEEFFNTMFVFTRFNDFTGCLVKAAVFGTVIPIVAAHHGFRCKPGSRGVGDAATGAVVQGSVLIICLDFVLTYLLYAL